MPLPLKRYFGWAGARRSGGDPEREEMFTWKSSDRFPGEDAQPAHIRAWRAGAPLSVLLDPVRPGEEYADEPTRLGAYSTRLWWPMLQALEGGR